MAPLECHLEVGRYVVGIRLGKPIPEPLEDVKDTFTVAGVRKGQLVGRISLGQDLRDGLDITKLVVVERFIIVDTTFLLGDCDTRSVLFFMIEGLTRIALLRSKNGIYGWIREGLAGKETLCVLSAHGLHTAA